MADLMKSFLFLLVYGLSVIEGEIRCYCNESGCVTTGYMCKSQLGTCYLQVTYSNADSMPTVVHGCADKLTERILRTCTGTTITDSDEKLKQNISDNTVEDNSSLYKVEITDSNVNNIVENSVDPSHDQTITCCSNDMCNYRDSLDISIVIDTQSNESAMKGRRDFYGTSSENKGLTSKVEHHPQKDLWFKAAVIAVPIAGGFILVLLVLLAVRMLRTDSRYHRRLIQIRRERSLTKAQLYVTDHFIDKPDKQNKLLSENHCHINTLPPKVTVSNGNTYEQVNTDKSADNCNENIPKVHSQLNSHMPYSSFIVLGKPKKNDFATVV